MVHITFCRYGNYIFVLQVFTVIKRLKNIIIQNLRVIKIFVKKRELLS